LFVVPSIYMLVAKKHVALAEEDESEADVRESAELAV
jgi:hypothetical protein